MMQPDAGSAIIFFCFIIPLFREGLSKWIPLFIIYNILIATGVIIFGTLLTILIFIPSSILLLLLFNNMKNYIKTTLILISSGIALTLITNFSYNNLAPHQKDRIDMVFGKLDTSYNVQQSLIAVGNGGVFGEGYKKGTQTNGAFVPKQSTDFIFSAIAEQFGFFGCSLIIILFLLLFYYILKISERQKSTFSRILWIWGGFYFIYSFFL